MKKAIYFFLLLFSVLFVSCKSARNISATLSVAQKTLDTIPDSAPVQSVATADAVKEPQITGKADVAIPSADITRSIKNVNNKGVERVVYYDFSHPDVPESFEGFRIAFISDLHYESLLKEEGLKDLVRLLIELKPDILLMGGDYQEGCQFVKPLFKEIARVHPPMGIYGVLGNNDYERCHDDIVRTMEQYGMHVLEHKTDTLRKNGQQIIIAGVRDPFDRANMKSPTLALSPQDFVILLVHTPDYVEDVCVNNTDLALAGHTHGGQVRMLGVTPVLNSRYGKRFLTGLAYNSFRTPLIVTNGIGTSRMPIRVGAPAEIVMITLHKLK